MDVNWLIGFIENTLDWYDHVAFHFLMSVDASAALSDIQYVIRQRHDNPEANAWRRLLISSWFQAHNPLESLKRDALIAVLYLLRQWKILKVLGTDVSTVNFRSIDPFRMTLFRILDDLDSVEVDRLVLFMESATNRQVRDRSLAEEAFLFWISERYVAPNDHAILDVALQHIGRQDLVDRFLSNRCYTMSKPGFCLIIQHRESLCTDISWLSFMFRQLGFEVQTQAFHSSIIPWKLELYRQDFDCYSCLVVCFLTSKYDPASVREYLCTPLSPLYNKAQIFIFDHPVTFLDTISPDSVIKNVMMLWPSESLFQRQPNEGKPRKLNDAIHEWKSAGALLRDLYEIWRSGQCRTWQSAVQTLNDRYKERDDCQIIHRIDNLLYAMDFRH